MFRLWPRPKVKATAATLAATKTQTELDQIHGQHDTLLQDTGFNGGPGMVNTERGAAI